MPDLQELSPEANLALKTAAHNLRQEFKGTFSVETKPWTDEIVRAADVVVTMGCGDACPIFPGKRYEDWVLDDPAGLGLDAVRPIRDEIRRRVKELLDQVTSAKE